jgi:hypothetical protein
MKHISSLLSSLLLLNNAANALHLNVKGKRTPSPYHDLAILPRADIHGSGLNDSADISYTCDLTLGGQSFNVLVDTGRYSIFFTARPDSLSYSRLQLRPLGSGHRLG